jgi:hypothetical protein
MFLLDLDLGRFGQKDFIGNGRIVFCHIKRLARYYDAA